MTSRQEELDSLRAKIETLRMFGRALDNEYASAFRKSDGDAMAAIAARKKLEVKGPLSTLIQEFQRLERLEMADKFWKSASQLQGHGFATK
jgi:hypothetical protein